jgi:hypothetical protein
MCIQLTLPGEVMALDEGLQATRMDWTAQQVVLGRPLSVWQVNLVALLAVLFVAFVGCSFSGPFVPLLVRPLGVTEPGAVARCIQARWWAALPAFADLCPGVSWRP